MRHLAGEWLASQRSRCPRCQWVSTGLVPPRPARTCRSGRLPFRASVIRPYAGGGERRERVLVVG